MRSLLLPLVLPLAASALSCGGKPAKIQVTVTAGTPTATLLPVEVKTEPNLYVVVQSRETLGQVDVKSGDRTPMPLVAGRADAKGIAKLDVPLAELAPGVEGVKLGVWATAAGPFDVSKPIVMDKGVRAGWGGTDVKLPLRAVKDGDTFRVLGPDCRVSLNQGKQDGSPGLIVSVMGSGDCTKGEIKIRGVAMPKKHLGIVNIASELDCAQVLDLATLDPRTVKQTVPIELAMPSASATLDLEMDASACAGTLARKVAEGPLLFPGETKDAAGAKTAVLLRPYRNDFGIVAWGDPATFAAVEYIAVESTTPRKYTCRYEGGQSEVRFESDATITVYRRRTGEKLGAKDFRAPKGSCASTLTVYGAAGTKSTDSGDMATRVPEATIRAFVEELQR